jgi:hypothetical protein
MVPGQQGVDERRHDRVVIADDSREKLAAAFELTD